MNATAAPERPKRNRDPGGFESSETPAPAGWLSRHFVFLVTVFYLLIYSLLYLQNRWGPPIRADGAGYYIYLPALVLHGDPSFQAVADSQFNGEMPEWTGVRRFPPTGRLLDRYSVGSALLMLPFFLLAHFLTWTFSFPVEGHPFSHARDGYSFFYQHAAGMAGVFYMVAGLAVLKKFLERHFSPAAVVWTLVSLAVGTNLCNYGTGDSVTSHAYSFFLFSLWLWLVPRWYERAASTGISLLVGLVAGLIPLVRVPNLMVLIFLPLYGVFNRRDVADRLQLLWKLRARLLGMALVAWLAFLPQMLLWKYATGHWLLNAYKAQGEGFNFLQPRIFSVLFGLKKGLFFWSPVLLFVLAGFPYLKRGARNFVLPVWLFLAANLYLVASWWMWWFGGGLGLRPMVESYAVMAIPLTCFFQASRSRSTQVLVTVGVAGCVLFYLFLMKMYYTGEVTHYGLDAQALYDIFWWRKEWLMKALSLR